MALNEITPSKSGRQMVGNSSASSHSAPSFSRDRIKMQINKIHLQGVNELKFNFFKSNELEFKIKK